MKKVFFTTVRSDLQKLIKCATTYRNLKGEKEKTNKKKRILDSCERHIREAYKYNPLATTYLRSLAVYALEHKM
jgi:hypothetical protein